MTKATLRPAWRMAALAALLFGCAAQAQAQAKTAAQLRAEACTPATGVQLLPKPTPNAQETPDKQLVCAPQDTGNAAVEKTAIITTDGQWSVKAGSETGYGQGAWIAVHTPGREEYYRGWDPINDSHALGGWDELAGAQWITPGSAWMLYEGLPPICTDESYLFARAVRISKLASGTQVTATGTFGADNRLQAVQVLQGDAGQQAAVQSVAAPVPVTGKNGADCGSHFNANCIGGDIPAADLTFAGGGGDNWLIFQVENTEDTHEARKGWIGATNPDEERGAANDSTDENYINDHPIGFTAYLELEATLDCTCPGDKVQDGEGSCVCPAGQEDIGGDACADLCTGGRERQSDGTCACPADKPSEVDGVCSALPPVSPSPTCAPPQGCSSAPAAGWLALLGLGAALPLLAVRRRRK